VSCVIGYMIFFAPAPVSAESVSADTNANLEIVSVQDKQPEVATNPAKEENTAESADTESAATDSTEKTTETVDNAEPPQEEATPTAKPRAKRAASSGGLGFYNVNNDVHYDIVGEKDGVLDYARTDYVKTDLNGDIHLNVSKWAKGSVDWGNTENGPYNGRYILNFFKEEFYSQIQSIEVNGVQFESESGGALWKVPINTRTFKSGSIGIITNDDVVIKLKSGKTLDSLGLAKEKISFTTLWVRGDGYSDVGGHDNGFILKDNPNIPELPINPADGNDSYLGKGMNGLGSDGTKSKDGNFTEGAMTKVVLYDAKKKVIKSVVSFKPDQNFLQANSGWVLYVNDAIPKELLPYIDTTDVRLGVSDPQGNFIIDAPLNIVVDENGNGIISTKDTPEISIADGGDWNKTVSVRDILDKKVFLGTLGQRRSYTIQYRLKDNVTNTDFAKKLNEFIQKNNSQMTFESWLEADFVDYTNISPATRKPDGGQPNKRLQNSYANAFLEVLDSDRDGLVDFVEDEIGTNKFDVDTDKDGVPDNLEVLEHKTDPLDAGSYLESKPEPDTEKIYADKDDQHITGSVPKIKYNHPDNNSLVLKATNPDAGNVIVRAYKYVDGDNDYSDNEVKGEVTIPYEELENGSFDIPVNSGTFVAGDKVVVVAYSPDGEHPVSSETYVDVVATTPLEINKIENQVVKEGEAIKDISVVSNKEVFFEAEGLPEGVELEGGNPKNPVYNSTIKGTPKITDWKPGEKERVFEVTVTANDAEDYNIKKSTSFTITVKKADVPAPGVEISKDAQTVIDKHPITDVLITPEDPKATVSIDGELPAGVRYDEAGKKITGTPDITNWGGKEDEERDYTVTVQVKNEDGSLVNKPVTIKVQRDTDKDGIPDVDDPDDDDDGIPDKDDNNPKVFDALDVTVTNPTDKAIEGKPIKTEKVVTPNKPNSAITSTETNGLSVDKDGNITGTPTVDDWGNDEEKEVKIPVTINHGKEEKTVEVTVTVQRDTDKDGIPDVDDPDDDDDGIPDTEEINKGSDPKDPNSIPQTEIIVPPTVEDIENQTVVEGNAITPVTPKVTEGSKVTVDGLGNGLVFENGTIQGTPSVDWNGAEERKDITITVKAEKDGATTSKTFVVTILRKTGGEGTKDTNLTQNDSGSTDSNVILTNSSVNKLGDSPKTGDESRTGLYGLLASLAASILFLGKKRKEAGDKQD
ncbi:MAG: sortase B protein-sorting domain-containing protein, partial [Clostridiales bacterium]|nr:sortase B protein-sorting domain-containing protein [Clostridiales bacterium]